MADGDKKPRATVEVIKHEITGDSPMGMLLGALLDTVKDSDKHPHERGEDCKDPSCKLCTGGVPKYKALTKEEAQQYVKDTSYEPRLYDEVRLNKHGKERMQIPGDLEKVTVVRILKEPLYDTTRLNEARGGVAYNVAVAFKKSSGKVIEMLYPSMFLELVSRDVD